LQKKLTDKFGKMNLDTLNTQSGFFGEKFLSSLNRSPKKRRQMWLFDLIYLCEDEDREGIRETWMEMKTEDQEQVWSFLASDQKQLIRNSLAEDSDEPPPF
jgi:hypothetical protein